MCVNVSSIDRQKEKKYTTLGQRNLRENVEGGWMPPPPPGTRGPPPITFEPPKLRKQIICQNVCLWTPYRYPRAKNSEKPQGDVIAMYQESIAV